MKTYAGILRQCSSSDCYEFWRDEDSGAILDGLRDCEDIPLETPIEITVTDDLKVIEWHRDYSAPAREVTDRITMALCRVRSQTLRPGDQEAIKKEATKLQNILRSQLPAVPIEVRGFAFVGASINNVNQLIRSNYSPEIERLDPEFAQRWNYLGIQSGARRTFSGNAFLGSQNFYVTLGLQEPEETEAHETGHASYGRLGHAGDRSGQVLPQYARERAIMGNQRGRDRYIAPHLDMLGAIGPEHKLRVQPGESVRVFLVDSQSRPEGLRMGGAGERKLIYLGREYAVSQEDGFVMIDGAGSSTGNFHQTWLAEELRVGDRVKVGDWWVAYEKRDWGASEIVVTGQTTRQPTPQDAPHYVIPEAPAITAEAHTGLWGVPSLSNVKREQPRQGLGLHVIGDELVGEWYIYDKRGNPVWFDLRGPIKGSVAQVTIRRLTSSGLVDDGEGLIYFADTLRGWFRYQSDTYGRGGFRLDRVTPLNATPKRVEFSKGSGASVFGETILWWERVVTTSGVKPRWKIAMGGILYEPRDGYPLIATRSALKEIGTARMDGNDLVVTRGGVDMRHSGNVLV